jgi:GT2 family glycosyltransferase
MADGVPPVRVSLVVVTYNRFDELSRLLCSLENVLDRPEVEIILIDDGSTDNTVERVTPLVQRLHDRATILFQQNSGPGTARNRGILHARGEIVVFVDTDCVVQPVWFQALTEPFADPQVGAVGGADRSEPNDPLFARLVDYLMTAFLTTGGIRGAKKARGGSYHPRSFNMAVRREAAVAAEGFPTIWYGEDILFSWRIAQAGWKLAFAPDAWLYHKRRTTVRAWARQLYRMGRARWWMGRYDRRLLEPIFLLPMLEWTLVLIAAGLLAVQQRITPVTGAFGVLVAAYALALGADSFRRTRHPCAILATPLLFALREGAYALGSVAGILTSIPDLNGALSRARSTMKEPP